MWFLQSVFEIDITQEVPLPPYNFNHPYHIEDNAQLGWGGERNEEGSMLSYFGNSVMLVN